LASERARPRSHSIINHRKAIAFYNFITETAIALNHKLQESDRILSTINNKIAIALKNLVGWVKAGKPTGLIVIERAFRP
jgi:hypothetical protein